MKKYIFQQLVFKVFVFRNVRKKKHELNLVGPKFMPHLMAYIVFTRFGVHGNSSPFWCEVSATSLAKKRNKNGKKYKNL